MESLGDEYVRARRYVLGTLEKEVVTPEDLKLLSLSTCYSGLAYMCMTRWGLDRCLVRMIAARAAMMPYLVPFEEAEKWLRKI